jgi:hypothetical protein
VVVRADSAGATHAFAQACRDRGVWFSFGFPVDARIQAIVDRVPGHCWAPAIESEGGIRDGAWVVEVTGMLDLAAWPEDSRVFLRAERPHPGAQLTFTDAEGHRITAFITDIPDRIIAGQSAGLELWPPSARSRGRSHSQEHRSAQSSLPWLGGKRRVAGNPPDRHRSRVLGTPLRKTLSRNA